VVQEHIVSSPKDYFAGGTWRLINFYWLHMMMLRNVNAEDDERKYSWMDGWTNNSHAYQRTTRRRASRA
jgi:hypothetical protein